MVDAQRPAGQGAFQHHQLREDAHDLRVFGPGSASTIRATSPEIKADDTSTLKVTLKCRGLYRLVCTLTDDELRGMVARIRVVRRRG